MHRVKYFGTSIGTLAKKHKRRLAPLVAALLAVSLFTACDFPIDSPLEAFYGDSRLDSITARGELICATQTDLPGFGFEDPERRRAWI